MKRSKMKLKTNGSKFTDWWISLYINFVLWKKGVDDDKDKAIEISGEILSKLKDYKLIRRINVISGVVIALLIMAAQYCIGKYLLKGEIVFLLINMIIFTFIYTKWFTFCFKEQ